MSWVYYFFWDTMYIEFICRRAQCVGFTCYAPVTGERLSVALSLFVPPSVPRPLVMQERKVLESSDFVKRFRKLTITVLAILRPVGQRSSSPDTK